MRLILAGGIPSWQDAALILPIMAGGDKHADPFDAIFGTEEKEEEAEASTTTFSNTIVAGNLVRDRDGNIWEYRTGTVAGPSLRIVQRTTWQGSGAITLSLAIRRFGRFFETETGRAIEANADGTFRQLTEGETGNLFPTGGGTGTRTSVSAPAFGSTRAAADLQIKAAADAAKLVAAARVAEIEAQRIFDEEQAEIDRELRLREARLTTARDLVNIRSAEAREARTQGVGLAGDDPFKFTAISRGLAGPTGTTPSAAFKTNLAQAGSFQAPDLTGLDSNALESVIGKLSQLNTPQQTGPFGFAHGGTVDVRSRAGGATQPGDGTVAIEVGEPINGQPNPEIVILRPDGSVEVVRKIGAAQTGGTFDFGGFGSLFNSLRQSVGFSTGAAGGRASVLQPGVASMLGARQRGLGSFVRRQNDPTVFQVTSTGLRDVGNLDIFSQLGGASGDVEFLSDQAFNRLQQGIGSGETFTPESAEGFQVQRRSGAFGAFAQPLTAQGGLRDLVASGVGFTAGEAVRIRDLIGFLPAPFKIPPAFFNSLSPTEQTALLSAYRLAGVPEEDFTFLRTAPQLSFNPQRATAVG